ncbi:MAG: alpha/beta hydrolase [Nitrososphaerota archaeon]|nr:alpha/beta hydrolase [Nitrososphaerota archaeon]MDG6923443.1 alpha/beta hydrolase [Nitrososphaerota archaeon]
MTTVHHPLTKKDREAMMEIRKTATLRKGALERTAFDQRAEQLTPAAPEIRCEEEEVGGVAGWWCRPDKTDRTSAILYLHGGGYRVGSARAFRNFVSQIAKRADISCFVPDYRLAPENSFPAAVEDCRAAYLGLTSRGFRDIVTVGDSAGGGLILILLNSVVPKPKASVALSPWTDLAITGETMVSRASEDYILSRESLAEAANQYLASHNARDPLASPLYGDLAGLPPVSIHVGEDEILLDDARRYVDKFSRAGGDIELHIWEGMTHVFQRNVEVLAAAEASLVEIGAFIRKRIGSV